MAEALDVRAAEKLAETYDPEVRFRKTHPVVSAGVTAALVAWSVYHYYTAGFGIPTQHWHSAVHLSFVMGLIFIVTGATPASRGAPASSRWWRPGGVPLWDWACAALAVVAALYYPMSYGDIAFRIGNPNGTDLLLGTALVLLLLEATRRAMGWPLTVIVTVALAYGLYGRYLPGLFAHPGASWTGLINHLYLTQEGIWGVPIQVIASYVFHFVLFGTVATRMGLGQLFLDLAQCAAGRYPGGPAKVGVLSSAMMGTISGSSVANTVTTGSLTIPAMKRIGYAPHFAGAVEAAASTGGQITPPIMGAAAFIMAEFLGIPYAQIMIAAIIPAAMHFLGVFVIVHLEAKRLGLKGLPPEEITPLAQVLRRGWPHFIPLGLLIGTILSGHTPFMAAFVGITACIAVGFLNPMQRMTVRDLIDSFALGAKYAIAVGAAAAAVGTFVGVITLSGVGFKISFVVTQVALTMAEQILPLFQALPIHLVEMPELTLFITLVMIAGACIAMGAGIPTTALYIILVAVAAPSVIQLGVPPLAAHLFVLYYGVLADLTPPVCVAAYAGAALAGADPFRTGLTAFRLGNAKILVPFVFVYSPAMLIVLDQYFSWGEFAFTTVTCALGVVSLGTALAGYLYGPFGGVLRLAMGLGSVAMVMPSRGLTGLGFAIVLPIFAWRWLLQRRRAAAA